MSRLRGIDISKWQGVINWGLLAPHIDFVLMRSAHGDVPTMAVDTQYVTNIANARLHKVPRGTYYFPGTRDPVVEADFYVDNTHRQDGELQMLDFEGPVLHVPNPPSWALRFLDRVFARTGNRPLIYMSQSVVHEHDWSAVVRRNYGLVVAKWFTSVEPDPGQWPLWAVWQDTDRFPVPGITVQAPDGDWFNGSLAQWAAYGRTGPAPVTHPVPPPRPSRKYTVEPGNTLWGIAVHFYGNGNKYLVIANANHIKAPYVIHPGDVLVIPYL